MIMGEATNLIVVRVGLDEGKLAAIIQCKILQIIGYLAVPGSIWALYFQSCHITNQAIWGSSNIWHLLRTHQARTTD